MITVRPGRQQKATGSSGSGNAQVSAPLIFPSPKGGLVTSTDLASDIVGAASVLDNWLPTRIGARIRGGSAKNALVEDETDLVSSFTYRYGGIEKMFMATETAIYDLSTPEVLPDTTPAAVASLTGGDWSTFMHTNTSGGYLIAVNGLDERQVFDGSAWTTPAMTFTDSTTSDQLSHGWLFKGREFYIKAGTLDAYYIDLVDAISGATKLFPLGGTMQDGGTLLTGFQWSVESGDGVNAFCCFVSTEGEVAVFSGSDPGGDDFGLRSTYHIGKPLGKTAWMAVSGDVLIATTNGLIAMSSVLQRDGDEVQAVSDAIDQEWNMAAEATGAGWVMTAWPAQKLILISFPTNVVVPDTTFVLNIVTKKWGFIRNWPALCYGTYQGNLYFGGLDGYCWQADFGGSDDGKPFQASYLAAFQAAGALGQTKSAMLGQMSLRAKDVPNVLLFARADGDISVPTMTQVSVGDTTSSEWDVGLWDLARWDEVSSLAIMSFRQDIRAEGKTLAMGCVIVSSGTVQLRIALDLAMMQVEGGEQSV